MEVLIALIVASVIGAIFAVKAPSSPISIALRKVGILASRVVLNFWVYRFGRFTSASGAMGWEAPFGDITMQMITYDTRRIAKKHPSGMYLLFDYCLPMLVITSPTVSKDFYRNHLSHVRTKSLSVLGTVCEAMIGEAIGAASGKEWATHARVLKQPFSASGAAARHRFIEQEVGAWIRSMEGRKAIPMTGDGIKVLTIDRLTLRIMSKVLYGASVMTEEKMKELFDVAGMHEMLMAHMGKLETRLPIISSLPSAVSRQTDEMKARWSSFHASLVKAVVSNGAALNQLLPPSESATATKDNSVELPNNGSVIWELAQMAASGEMSLSHMQVLDNFDELLLLNLDVMFGTLGHVLHDLAVHPEEQEKVRQEVLEFGEDYLLSASVSLPVMDRFVIESSRVHPQIILTLPECTPEDCTLGGYRIPASTVVAVDCDTLNHDPNTFGKDVDVFRPDRFLENPDLVREVHRFGLGPRKCLGQKYAESITRCVLCHLLSKYRLYFEETPAPPVKKRPFGIVFLQPEGDFPDPCIAPLNT